MTTEPVADCEFCGTPLHEGDDYDIIAEGLVWICRSCVEAEEDHLREEFGWIGAWKGEVTGRGGPPEFPGREVCRDEHEESPPFRHRRVGRRVQKLDFDGERPMRTHPILRTTPRRPRYRERRSRRRRRSTR